MAIAGSVWRLDTAPILFLIIVGFVSIKPSSSDQICEAFDQGSCPEDTCCSDSECLKEGGEYQCSPKGPEGPGFSNCPKCINCQWEAWSPCTVTDFEQKCGNGLSPKNVTGQKTRKHRTQTDGQGNQVVTGPGGICNGTIINGIEYDTKAPCEKPCAGPGPGPNVGLIIGLCLGAVAVIFGLIAFVKRDAIRAKLNV